MALSRIVVRLARNPGSEFADGDDHRGYSLVAPLTPDGKLDEAAFRAAKGDCAVRRFLPGEEPQEGKLVHRNGRWFFDYGDQGDAEEPLYRLGEHRFAVGEYVSITDEDGRLLTYKVTEVRRA
ncbi:MAG TPA: hypothetical protein VN805_03280 [Caulobacteraceae bacterium]|nr:hypothetical protein [Caulobacteraceae bacterium]